MRNILFVLTAVILTTGLIGPAQAGVKSLTVKVDGLACPFCAYGLEKKLKKVEGVEKLNIDINTGEVILNVTAGTRLTAAPDAEKKASTGLVIQVQKAVEEGGFTPRAIRATVEGRVVAQNGETQLKLSGTGEFLALEKGSGADELHKLEGGGSVQVAGMFHPGTSPLRFTVERIISPAAGIVRRLKIAGMVCTGCVEAIQTGLEKREGVRSFQIDLESGLAKIVVEDERISGETLAELVNTLAMEGMPAGTFAATALEE
jgi:copper chaperone CopZ